MNKLNYARLSIALGGAVGAVFGVLTAHVSAWLVIGVAVGLALSVWIRRKGKGCPECVAPHDVHEIKKSNATS
jgi:hypothetical protein